MTDMPTKDGVYQDQDGRGFAVYKGRMFFLVMGRQVREPDLTKIEDLVLMQPASGNVEPNFKPFRTRQRPVDIEEAP